MKLITKIFFLAIALVPFRNYVFSQKEQDPEAKEVLDRFSKKTKSFKAYQLDFTIIDENKQTGEKTENKGTLLIKGEKYKLEFNKTEIYFDGKFIYNYIPESNEVSIAKPGKKSDDLFTSNPAKFFNIYTADYKFQYIGNINENGHKCYEVDLYPFDIKKKYSIIKLLIDIDKLELVAAKLIMKSGINYTVKIDTFNGNINASDPDFVFNIKAHKGVEVVDLR